MTVNQQHFKEFELVIKSLMRSKLIYGLGISVNKYDYDLVKSIKDNDNIVLHVIAGLIELDELRRFYNENLKILILGYKDFRRGHELYNDLNRPIINFHMDLLRLNLCDIIKHFRVVSFDNLAIDQLRVRDCLSASAWNSFYQGDDGSHTFYNFAGKTTIC